MPDTVPKKVLLMGFQSDVSVPQHFRDLFGTPDEISAKIRNDHARIQRAGITPVAYLLNSHEVEKGLKDLESLLREGSYDAIGIGAGVRLVPAYSALFERIVNMCIALAPGVPLLFNDGPDGSTAASE
ncbi:hypothetical protein RRF57_007452 [Xylaria bambusicola]|uniref:Uncharacterized protein n=1 Tax=Xylaria bambusicola TaxID=326684 RepID=A0AAN7UL55_9PEZI